MEKNNSMHTTYLQRNEPAPKKTKSEGSSSKRLKNEAGETYFELERNRRVTVREFRGKLIIDVREFYEKDGKYLHGKKGETHIISSVPPFLHPEAAGMCPL